MYTSFRNKSTGNPFTRIGLRRGLAFGLIIIAALLAFEFFNFSTTSFALTDLLGDLRFAGIKWATILAIAFCGIDFAGIARLFTPEAGNREPSESWYLFGAWLLAATMNAMLTWWGVSLALLNQSELGNAVVDRETLLRVVPIFVAILVWLIRVLIISTFSVAGDRLFSQSDQNLGQPAGARNGRPVNPQTASIATSGRGATPALHANPANGKSSFRPAPPPDQVYTRPEPTYHPVGMDAQPSNNPGRRSTFTGNH